MTAKLWVFMVLGISLTPGAIAATLTNEYQLAGTLNEGRSFTVTSEGFSGDLDFQGWVTLPLAVTFPEVPAGVTDYLAALAVNSVVKGWTLTCNPEPCDDLGGAIYHPPMVDFTGGPAGGGRAPDTWYEYPSDVAGKTYDLTFEVQIDVIEFEAFPFGSWEFKGPSTYDIRVSAIIEPNAPPLVPEPSSFVLIGLAISGAGLLKLRKRR